MISYTCRFNAFEKARKYILSGSALVVADPVSGEQLKSYAWEDLKEIRLQYTPTRFVSNKYSAYIKFSRGGTLKLTNQEFDSFASFKDRSGDYLEWIRELHRISGGLRWVRYYSGIEWGLYFFYAVLSVFSIIGVGAAFYYIPFSPNFSRTVRILVFAVLLVMSWFYMKANIPRSYEPHELPRGVLPKTTAN